jgi:hypothetical protein
VLLSLTAILHAQDTNIIVGFGQVPEFVEIGVHGIHHFLDRLMVVVF